MKWESVRKCEKVDILLIGGFNPPEKYESQIGSSSQLLGKIKFMFQTTNQTWINDDIFGLDNDYNNIRLAIPYGMKLSATAWRPWGSQGLPIIQSRGMENISWYGHVMWYMICLLINETWGYHQNIMGLNQSWGGCSANMMGYITNFSFGVPKHGGPRGLLGNPQSQWWFCWFIAGKINELLLRDFPASHGADYQMVSASMWKWKV